MMSTKQIILFGSIFLFIYLLIKCQHIILKEGYDSNHRVNVIFCG
jgi:hypothetical protein